MSTDTSRDAQDRQIALLREAGPTRRAAIAASLTQSVIDLSKRAIRRRHPEATQPELDRRFVVLHYGEDVARLLDA